MFQTKPRSQHGVRLTFGGEETAMPWFSRHHAQSNNVQQLLVIPKSVRADNWQAVVVLQW